MPKRKSKPKSSHRVFSREFKIGIICRMQAGESVSALARELKMTRKDLYAWRDRFQAGGPEALRGRGRPPKSEAAGLAAIGTSSATPADTPAAELEAARKRIAELERKVGQQQLDLDFFQRALRHVGAPRQPGTRPGVTGSTKSSKR
jgi:transposase-like protein